MFIYCVFLIFLLIINLELENLEFVFVLNSVDRYFFLKGLNLRCLGLCFVK